MVFDSRKTITVLALEAYALMPGNIQSAAPNGVPPASLCTAFTELREYVQL